MPVIKIASGVVNQTPMAWDTNEKHLLNAIGLAKKENVGLFCLPELSVSGYGCEDYFFSPDLLQRSKEVLLNLVPHTEGIIVSVGLPVSYQNRLYNAACLIADRRIVGFYCKQFLANNGIHYEARWFHAWPKGLVGSIEIDGIQFPIGDIVFEIGAGSTDKIRVAFEICEDAWVADRPGKRHYDRAVDIILNPSASHFAFGKYRTREQLVLEGSRAFGCSYVYTNLLGNEAGQAVYDGDAMIASNGKMLASGPRFSYADYFIVSAIVDTDRTRLSQVQNKKEASKEADWRVPVYFSFNETKSMPVQNAETEAFERGNFVKEEEFARAVCLALFDYLRKSRSNGFTVSLSGGADSSACAALVSLMLYLGDESIGISGLKEKLSYIAKIKGLNDVAGLTKVLLETIYQGTRNSSDTTLSSARSLAESVNATFYQINIDEMVEGYKALIESQIGRNLSWETDDIPLQNIQARVRAPGVWLLTNLSGNLLLATSNRSEVAVGYATMDGDTAGSISPIAGIDKFWLRGWLIWLEKVGCEVKGRHIQIAGLKEVNALQPTAELRPLEKVQTDEADLMPYELLNELENYAIRDKMSPLQCFRQVEDQFAGRWSKEQLLHWTERFFRLWSRNQWKRERYAPSFHLDDHNLNPRSWCRFPILSGGFERELALLRADFDKDKSSRRKGKIGF
ncbi:NAD(+) synthase [Ravibacter arvi]|uniref:Glutamine-dependent NAD(+) synthetase n=1 Tax=Ravibacter arvi TaxID=2051041 RepID=A0ABP8LN10_9BACT